MTGGSWRECRQDDTSHGQRRALCTGWSSDPPPLKIDRANLPSIDLHTDRTTYGHISLVNSSVYLADIFDPIYLPIQLPIDQTHAGHCSFYCDVMGKVDTMKTTRYSEQAGRFCMQT